MCAQLVKYKAAFHLIALNAPSTRKIGRFPAFPTLATLLATGYNLLMEQDFAIFSGGCFWCVEAVFQSLQGVETIESGYIGGHINHPDYKAVCSGLTGHAEAVRIGFDPARITYRELLAVFFATHDPTQLNRQGNDIGTQYRSAIFPLNDAQAEAARQGIATAQPDWPAPIVTTIEPATQWWPAEDYHQRYWDGEGQRNPYCLAVIPPKLAKLRKSFAARVKG